MKTIICVASAFMLLMNGCSKNTMQQPSSSIEQQLQRFVPVELKGTTAALSPADRKALAKLYEAAAVLDTIYEEQIWSGNRDLRIRLEADKTKEGAEVLRLYRIYRSPWSDLEHGAPFVTGMPSKRPDGSNYYPPDMTKEEFESWVATLNPAEKEKAVGFFHVIRRDGAGRLKAVPYHVEYKSLLERAAGLLREAANLTDNAGLRKFLNLRADAFLSNDYYASDVAWMDLDSPIEPTIGPYEVYMDELFNYKAAFEAYITLRNDEETKKLYFYAAHLQEIEDHLPIEASFRNKKLGALAPIRVVDEVMTGGEARAGVQTAAFNLPNDERVVREKGSKRVMLKNVQEAKFEKILRPIAALALSAEQKNRIAFEPFFTHILAHELMHGLGPHTISVNGAQTTVRREMKEIGSALEEAKADISGLFALQYLMDRGLVDRSMEEPMYITYLAGVFRSVRFGINEAHGRGMALQFNYLQDEGAFTFDAAGSTFSVRIDKMKTATVKLTGAIMTLQAHGEYAGAKQLLDKYAVIRPEMQTVLDKLKDIPIDIAPTFVPPGS